MFLTLGIRVDPQNQGFLSAEVAGSGLLDLDSIPAWQRIFW